LQCGQVLHAQATNQVFHDVVVDALSGIQHRNAKWTGHEQVTSYTTGERREAKRTTQGRARRIARGPSDKMHDSRTSDSCRRSA
jgi:hypothetical protein